MIAEELTANFRNKKPKPHTTDTSEGAQVEFNVTESPVAAIGLHTPTTTARNKTPTTKRREASRGP